MASHQDFVDYVAEQLAEAGTIRSRKMFGEYGLYCNEVFFAVICDDQLFVKVTPAGRRPFPIYRRLRLTRGQKTTSGWRMWRSGSR